MKKIALLTSLLISLSLYAQTPAFEWAINQGGSFVDFGLAIATDTLGNVYTTGSFSNNSILSDTADFDPGPNFYGLVSNGESDIFVSKISPDGDLLWAVSFGGDESDFGMGITTDASGNVYITGVFKGWVDFDPGPETYPILTSLNYSAVFVVKLNTNGVLLWAKQMGGGVFWASGSSWGNSIAVDDAGNVYTTGKANDGGDFDPGPNEFLLTTNTNSSNVFISKLDGDGNFVWAKAIGGEEGESSNDIVLDSFNNVYITGNFQDVVDFDPNSGVHNLSAIGSGGLYILKLDDDGNFIWAKNMGGISASATGQGLAIDIIGNIYVTGFFFGNVDFDPGSMNYELSAIGKDIFILKLDVNGGFIWAKSIGGEKDDCSSSIVIDRNNNVYISGFFRDTVDFDPGLDTYSLSAIDGGAYTLKLDTGGSFLWAVSFIGIEDGFLIINRGESIAIDRWDNIYTTGIFIDTTDFDPSATDYDLVTNGSTDIFVQKMNQFCNTALSISSPNVAFTICNRESIVLNATLPSSIQGISYSWNTGDTSDAIVVTPDSSSIYSVSVSYAYNNLVCTFSDSVEITVLEMADTTYLDFTICDPLGAGEIELIYSSQNGCDSIVLEITNFIPIPDMPIAPSDLMIEKDEPPFQVTILENPAATEYLWAVPVGVQILSGAGTTSILVNWNGLTTSGPVCVSAINECGNGLAACMEVTVNNMDTVENGKTKGYRIFPNPTANLLNIDFESGKIYEITLFDVSGKQLYNKMEEAGGHVVLSTKGLASGAYWLRMVNETEVCWEQIEVIK